MYNINISLLGINKLLAFYINIKNGIIDRNKKAYMSSITLDIQNISTPTMTDFKRGMEDSILKCQSYGLKIAAIELLKTTEIKSEIKKFNATQIFLRYEDTIEESDTIEKSKISYSLDDKIFQEVTNPKITELFQKSVLKSIKYLEWFSITKREITVLDDQQTLIDDSKNIVNKIDKETLDKIKKIKPRSTEWALWVIWGMESRNFFIKFFKSFSISSKSIENLLPFFSEYILSFTFCVIGLFNGFKMLEDHTRIHDSEGISEAKNKIIRNLILIIGGILFISFSSFDIVSFTIALRIVFMLSALYVASKNYFSMKMSEKLESKIKLILENTNFTKQERAQALYVYLKSKVTVSDKECLEIIKDINTNYIVDPISEETANLHVKNTKIKKEILHKLITKNKRLSRRIGSEAVEMIINAEDSIAYDFEKMKILITKVINGINAQKKQNFWIGISIFCQAIEIFLMIFDRVLVASTFGYLSSLITIILLGAYFYGIYFSYSEKNKINYPTKEFISLLGNPDL